MRSRRHTADPTRWLRGFLAAGALAAISFASACNEDSGGPTGPGDDPEAPGEISGSYALSGVRHLEGRLNGGGAGLPVTFTDDAGTPLTFQNGVLTLAGDGSYSLFVGAVFGDTEVELTDEGTYSHAGGAVVFTSTAESQRLSTGMLAGTAMTAVSQFGGFEFEIDVQRQ